MKTSPHLINISSDPSLSGVLLYLIPQGEIIIGNEAESHIKLAGNLIHPRHCSLSRELVGISSVIKINPISGETYLNGDRIEKEHVLKSGDRLVFGGTHYFAFRSGCDNESNLNFDEAKNELLESQRAEMERNYREMLEKNRAEMQSEIHQIKREFQTAQIDFDIDTDDVKPADASLLQVIQKISQDLDGTDEEVIVDWSHFELNQLIKEANQIAANDVSENHVRFEVSASKVGTLVKVVRDNQWATFLSVEHFKQQVGEMKMMVQDDADESITTFILRGNDNWELITPNVNDTDNTDKIRSRRRLSKRISQLAMRSGLDASVLDPPIEESSSTSVHRRLLMIDMEERPKSDSIYQSLRALELLYKQLDDYTPTNADVITHHVLLLRYAMQFGYEGDGYNIQELRSKVIF